MHSYAGTTGARSVSQGATRAEGRPMTTPDTFPVPDKRVPPAPAVPRRVTARKWTGTLPDKYVATLVELVSPTRLEAAVEALAAFHTRHTFSSNIGPAADWIVGQVTAAGECGGGRRPWARG